MSKGTIFVVDDDPDVVESLRIVLESEGYAVKCASTGSSALSALPEVKPDLIILDVMMETDTDGFRVAWQVRNAAPDSPYAAFRKVPILMLTAIGKVKGMTFSPEKDGDLLPVDQYVEKPIRPHDLIGKVQQLLEKK